MLILKDISIEGKFLHVLIKRSWYNCSNPRIKSGFCTSYFILLFVLTIPFSTSFAAKGDKVVRRVQERFESITALIAHFEVRYQISGSPEVHSEVGKIFMDGEGRFRTETTEQILICDGQAIWMYNVSQQQVIIRRKNEGTAGIVTPQRLFYEYPDLFEIEEIRKEEFNGHPCHLLVMTPRQETDPTRQLLVWIDQNEYLTRKFQVEDLADNITAFEFEAFQLGEPLPEGTFQFVPPEGVEIIDMR